MSRSPVRVRKQSDGQTGGARQTRNAVLRCIGNPHRASDAGPRIPSRTLLPAGILSRDCAPKEELLRRMGASCESCRKVHGPYQVGWETQFQNAVRTARTAYPTELHRPFSSSIAMQRIMACCSLIAGLAMAGQIPNRSARAGETKTTPPATPKISSVKHHWAFRPPVRPELPASKYAGEACSAIDRFVRARLEAEGLAPSPQTDRYTLIRRVTLDLTGLPPSIEDVDAFMNDPAPDAYAKVVDRLFGVAGIRGTMGAVVARSRPLRGFERIRIGPHAIHLAVARLGDRPPSTTTCRSIDSRLSRSRATCFPMRPIRNASRPGFTATRGSTKKAATTGSSSATSRSWIASTRRAPCSWVSPWPARSAMTTSTIRFRNVSTGSYSPSSTMPMSPTSGYHTLKSENARRRSMPRSRAACRSGRLGFRRSAPKSSGRESTRSPPTPERA